jgi:uncharacterized membrane protein (DUF106 family)
MSITAAMVRSMDFLFSGIFILPPILSILFFSILMSIITLILSKILINKDTVKEIKAKMNELKNEIKKAKKENNTKVVLNNLKEMINLQNMYLKENMKVFVISLVIGLIFLIYMSTKYANVSLNLPFLGININWIYWYIITSLITSIIIRKIVGDI